MQIYVRFRLGFWWARLQTHDYQKVRFTYLPIKCIFCCDLRHIPPSQHSTAELPKYLFIGYERCAMGAGWVINMRGWDFQGDYSCL